MASIDRLTREKKTVKLMIELYCKQNHYPNTNLCEGCNQLLEYALKRVEQCKYGEKKPTCGKCTIHCYQREKRKQIIEVMRYSGPRMLARHPILAIRHLVDGRKKPVNV